MSDSNDLLSSDNVKLGALALGALWYTGNLPEWWILGGSAIAIAAIAALFATGKIDDLMPDPRSVRIVQINANGEPVAGWKMSPDMFAEMEVKWGPLYPHEESPFECYECYVYNPETNVAVGTWRRSIPGSQIVGRHDVDDVLAVVGDLRDRLEQDARRFDELRTQLPAIVRELEYHSAEMQSAALDPSSPMKTDKPSIDEVIQNNLSDELRPGHLQESKLAELAAAKEPEPSDGFDSEAFEVIVEDDGDALEPVATDGGATDEQ